MSKCMLYTTLLFLFSISLVGSLVTSAGPTTINLGSYATYAGSTVTVLVEVLPPYSWGIYFIPFYLLPSMR